MSLKRFGFVLTGLLYLISLPAEAYIPQLTPQSFEQLYAYAAAGKVEVITNAVSRGMNIDSVNANGDTGLCVAAKRGNRRAYKSFLMTGANPSHQCTWNISGYRDFMNSVILNPVKNQDTAAVAKYGKKPMSWTTKALIGAGVVAAGAGTAIALSGGGGGGGGSSVDPNCVHGHYDDSNVCVCDTGYAGDKCNDCASGYGHWGTSECYKDIDDCGHGSQVGAVCKCDEGYTGTNCGACASGYGYNASGECVVQSAPMLGNSVNTNYNQTGNISLNSTTYQNVFGLFYDAEDTYGQRAPNLDQTTFVNTYKYLTDEGATSIVGDDTPLHSIGSKTSTIKAIKNGSGNVYGMYSATATDIYNNYIYLENGIVQGTLDASVSITSNGDGKVYGIYGNGNIYNAYFDGTAGYYEDDEDSANNVYSSLYMNSTVNVSNAGSGDVYGIYNGAADGTIYNENSSQSYTDTDNITHTLATLTSSVTAQSTGSGNVYGLYSKGSVVSGALLSAKAASGDAYGFYAEGDVTLSYQSSVESANGNAYGIFSASNGSLIASNYLDVTSTNAKAYGIHALKGGTVSNGGQIKVQSNGSDVYGAYVKDATFTNSWGTSSGALIASTTKGDAYGVYTTGNSTIDNTSSILATTSDGNAYGIYNIGGNITNSATFPDKSVYVKNEGSSGIACGIYSDGGTVTNSGRIDVYGQDGVTTYGIWAKNNAVVTIKDTFVISINNSALNSINYSTYCTSSGCTTPLGDKAIYLESGATLVNEGVLASTSALSLGTKGVTLAASGKISSPVLSGGLSISSGAVTSGFDQTYTLTGAIDAADTSALNLSSESVLFDAALDGKNVVLTKKSFNDVIENASFADFLEENYSAGKNEALFGMLKSEKNLSTLNKMAQDLTGANLSRFALDDMMAIKELDFQFNDAVLNNTKPEFALSGETVPSYLKNKTNSHSRWALSGKKEGNKTYGVGMALTTTRNLKDKKNDKRYDQMFQMVMPISYEKGGFEFITTPRLGYAYGTYTRQGFNGSSYDGKIEKRIFGLSNAVRYPVLFEGWTLSPSLEFNAVGYHIKGHEDNKQFALKINKQNIASVEAGFGLGLSKALKIEKEGDLKFNSQVMLYHEFADPYKLKLSMQDMDGSFVVNDEKLRKEHLTVKTGLEYHLKGFSIYSNLFSYIDSTYHTKADIGFKYAF
ncbi:MAG: hypothetical protein IJ830_00795 [Alphaproteobacteria bacterium]|nr:hypothetical protein [Alphaproteobacteria bacterium]